jgi:hypothetical protein
MNNMIKTKQLTQDGADWLTLRLDPYHDFNRPIAGYPDADANDTIVMARNYEYNVSKPAGSAGNWSAHVFTLPLDYASFEQTTSTNARLVGNGEVFYLGLVNVAKDDTGCPLYMTADPVVSPNFSCASIDTFAGIEDGMSRVIGMGIEIIDTTSEMYKQGALTAYKMPITNDTHGTLGYTSLAGDLQAQAHARILTAPPSTVAEAILYRSSVQWETRDGAYMVVGQQGIQNPFETASREFVAITPDSEFDGVDVAMLSTVHALTAFQVPPLITTATSQVCKKINVTQSGIFLSDLANSATFKIRVRVYLERAPLRGEVDLIPLSSPSAPYDYKALALYSYLVSELPVCVPVSFNAKGDWWRWIVNTVAKLAPILGTVLTPIVGPEAMLIGNAVGGAAASVREATKAVTAVAKTVRDAKKAKRPKQKPKN